MAAQLNRPRMRQKERKENGKTNLVVKGKGKGKIWSKRAKRRLRDTRRQMVRARPHRQLVFVLRKKRSKRMSEPRILAKKLCVRKIRRIQKTVRRRRKLTVKENGPLKSDEAARLANVTGRAARVWAKNNGVSSTGDGRRKTYYWTDEDIDRFLKRPRPGKRPRKKAPY
jgi:hypothetical protein